MKLNYTDGCICTSLTVDGKETIDMDIEDFKKVIKKLLSFGKEHNYTVLWECVAVLIEETCYLEHEQGYDEPDGEFTNHYECHVNGKEYSYVEEYDRALKKQLDTLTIDGEKWNCELTDEMYDDMCTLIDNIDDSGVLQYVFCHVLERCGTYECSDRPCECCGDYIRSSTLEIY